jgi:hypothetical protein
MATASLQASGGSMSAEEILVREVHSALTNCGMPIGSSKASRIVRQYTHRVRPNSWDFFDFVVNKLALTVERQKRLAAEWHRAISYLDPVGEEAVHTVLQERGF